MSEVGHCFRGRFQEPNNFFRPYVFPGIPLQNNIQYNTKNNTNNKNNNNKTVQKQIAKSG